MNKYGRFFLVYEEDEEITVKPNKRSIDYTADVEEPVEDNPDNAEEPIEEPAGDDNNVDATAEDEPVDTEIDDDTDYTADIGDDGTPVEDNAVDNNTTDDGTEPTEPTKLKPGLEYDSTRRYKQMSNQSVMSFSKIKYMEGARWGGSRSFDPKWGDWNSASTAMEGRMSVPS